MQYGYSVEFNEKEIMTPCSSFFLIGEVDIIMYREN